MLSRIQFGDDFQYWRSHHRHGSYRRPGYAHYVKRVPLKRAWVVGLPEKIGYDRGAALQAIALET